MYVSKTKMGKRELILEAVHYVNCISDFAFLSVNCFRSFSCARKRHESNKSVKIVHELQFFTTYYRNTNDVSTHAWP